MIIRKVAALLIAVVTLLGGCISPKLHLVKYNQGGDYYLHEGAKVKLPSRIGQFVRNEKPFPVSPDQKGTATHYFYENNDIKAFSTIFIYPWNKEIVQVLTGEDSTNDELFLSHYEQTKNDVLQYNRGIKVYEEDYLLKHLLMSKLGKKFICRLLTAGGEEGLEYLFLFYQSGWMIKIRLSHLEKYTESLDELIEEFIHEIEIK